LAQKLRAAGGQLVVGIRLLKQRLSQSGGEPIDPARNRRGINAQ
jgi:hypothetical protein